MAGNATAGRGPGTGNQLVWVEGQSLTQDCPRGGFEMPWMTLIDVAYINPSFAVAGHGQSRDKEEMRSLGTKECSLSSTLHLLSSLLDGGYD